jgi:hypothetical protein
VSGDLLDLVPVDLEQTNTNIDTSKQKQAVGLPSPILTFDELFADMEEVPPDPNATCNTLSREEWFEQS